MRSLLRPSRERQKVAFIGQSFAERKGRKRKNAPVPENSALELALEHYGFCPDVYQGGDYPLGALADSLSHSKIWYFWWD